MSRGIVFSAHAAKRMFERSISVDDVLHVIESAILIEDYPDDWPYPSRLLLGLAAGRHLHVVVAHNPSSDELIVVTLYEPDPDKWDSEFKRRIQ
jgi:hypothetical protein